MQAWCHCNTPVHYLQLSEVFDQGETICAAKLCHQIDVKRL